MPNTADLSTQLTKTIRLNIPMLSAAMDTVMKARLALGSSAQEGGIGFIHKNMSIERQAEEVKRVKKHEPAWLPTRRPSCRPPLARRRAD
ncbi:MAG: IMP dehydrogenase [Enterobacteriaceae bacterium]